MYVEQSGLSIGLNAASAGLNLGMDSMNAYDGLMKEKAKSDMFYAQAQLNANTQEFLRDLEQRNDYENYETYAKQFLTKQKNALQKNIKNNYTAELYSQLFTTAENSLNNTIQAARMQKEYEAIGTQNASAIALNNNTLSGQNAIDANNSIINSEYANGMRNSGYTRAAHLKNASESIAKEWTTAADAKIQNIINNGGDFSEVEKLIDEMALNNEYKVMMLSDKYASPEGLKYANAETGEGYVNIGNEIDKKQIAKELKSTLKTKYNAMVNEMQEKNMGTITEWEVDMFRLSPSEQITFATNALMKLDRDFGGNKLSPSQRNQAANIFKAIKNGSTTNGTNKGIDKIMDDFIKTKQSYFIKVVNNGSISGYLARQKFEEVVLEKYQELKNNPDLTLKNLREDFPEVMGFLDALKKEVPDEIKGILTQQEADFKEALKEIKLDKNNELISGYMNLLWDDLLACKYSDKDGIEYIKEKLETERKALKGKKLDILRNNFVSGKNDYKDGVFTTEEDNLAKFLYNAEQHPGLMMTDENGRVKPSVFANGGEVFDMAETSQRKLLEKVTGIPEDTFKSAYETEKRVTKNGTVIENPYDVASVQIFSADQGKTQYKVRSADGKNLVISKSVDGGNTWEKVETEEQKNQKKNNEHKAEIKTQANSVAKNVDMNILRNAGITSQEWQKRVAMKDYNWLAIEITNMVNQYDNAKDERQRTALKKKLDALGYEVN